MGRAEALCLLPALAVASSRCGHFDNMNALAAHRRVLVDVAAAERLHTWVDPWPLDLDAWESSSADRDKAENIFACSLIPAELGVLLGLQRQQWIEEELRNGSACMPPPGWPASSAIASLTLTAPKCNALPCQGNSRLTVELLYWTFCGRNDAWQSTRHVAARACGARMQCTGE